MTHHKNLIASMQWVAILSNGEARAALRDYRLARDNPADFGHLMRWGGGEAVTHFGGPRAVIEAARKWYRANREHLVVSQRYEPFPAPAAKPVEDAATRLERASKAATEARDEMASVLMAALDDALEQSKGYGAIDGDRARPTRVALSQIIQDRAEVTYQLAALIVADNEHTAASNAFLAAVQASGESLAALAGLSTEEA